jgi:hypothetical protein
VIIRTNKTKNKKTSVTLQQQQQQHLMSTRKQKCTLEEFFAEDDDIPDFYICNTFTDVIFKVPVLLNGRIYEQSEILHWIQKEGTDPFSRRPITDEPYYIQPVMKSAIGLDAFMLKKVNTYCDKLQQFAKQYAAKKRNQSHTEVSLSNNDYVEHESNADMMDLSQFISSFTLFLCCIVKPDDNNNRELKTDMEMNIYSEDHYVRARNFCVSEEKFLNHFRKQDLLCYVMHHAKNNKLVLDSVVAFIEEFYNNNERLEETEDCLFALGPLDLEKADTHIPNSNFLHEVQKPNIQSVLEVSATGITRDVFAVPDGVPSNLESVVVISQFLIPKLRANISSTSNANNYDSLPVLYYIIDIFKRDYKSFWGKWEIRTLVVTRRSLMLFKESTQKDLQNILKRSNGCTLRDILSITSARGSGSGTKLVGEIFFDNSIYCKNHVGITGMNTSSAMLPSSKLSNVQIVVGDAKKGEKWLLKTKKDIMRELCYVIKFLSLLKTTI